MKVFDRHFNGDILVSIQNAVVYVLLKKPYQVLINELNNYNLDNFNLDFMDISHEVTPSEVPSSKKDNEAIF